MSLYYLISYLVGGGIMMLAVPEVALRLLFANGTYGDVMPRVVGALMIALGMLVIQVLRQGLHTFYAPLVAIRVGLCTTWATLFFLYRDPLFLSLLGVVGLGVLLTVAGMFIDASSPSRA